MPTSRAIAGLVLVGLLLAPGCAKQVAQGAVAGALSRQNRDLAADFLNDPRFAAAVHKLAEGLITGALGGLTDEELNALVRERVDAFVGTVSPGIATALNEEISPALQKTLKDNLTVVINTALGDRARTNAARLVDTVAAVTAATIAEGLTTQVGPAAETILIDDVGPGLQRAIEKNVGPAVGLALRDEIVPAVASELDKQRGALVQELGATLDDGKEALRLLLAAAIAALAGLVVLAVILDRARRRREETLGLITETIKRHEGDEAVLTLVESIRERGKDTPEGAYLSEYLRKNRQYKIERRRAAS